LFKRGRQRKAWLSNYKRNTFLITMTPRPMKFYIWAIQNKFVPSVAVYFTGFTAAGPRAT